MTPAPDRAPEPCSGAGRWCSRRSACSPARSPTSRPTGCCPGPACWSRRGGRHARRRAPAAPGGLDAARGGAPGGGPGGRAPGARRPRPVTAVTRSSRPTPTPVAPVAPAPTSGRRGSYFDVAYAPAGGHHDGGLSVPAPLLHAFTDMTCPPRDGAGPPARRRRLRLVARAGRAGAVAAALPHGARAGPAVRPGPRGAGPCPALDVRRCRRSRSRRSYAASARSAPARTRLPPRSAARR